MISIENQMITVLKIEGLATCPDCNKITYFELYSIEDLRCHECHKIFTIKINDLKAYWYE